MLPAARDYDELYRTFRWQVPAQYNIGVDCCDRWAAQDPNRLAILHIHGDGRENNVTYGWLRDTSNRLANVLRAQGVRRGDRVAIFLPQAPEVAAAHFAIYKLAAIALPIAILFGPDALAYRLQNSGAKAILTSAQGMAKLEQVRDQVPDLACIIATDGNLDALLSKASSNFTPEDTSADDPAMMIYTSGTTGQPKGALHGHRVLLGHLPGAELPHYPFPSKGDRFWTPADWAWAGGLLDVLLPSLHHGIPVVARRFDKFDPDEAFALMASAKVRNTFIPPTALRMMRAVPSPRGRYDIKLRSMGSGGEALGVEALDWGRDAFGVTINEFYGQTECNLVLGSCEVLGALKPGAIGKAVPGHKVAVVDAEGQPVKPGEIGQIAVMRPDPVMFLEY
jgi:acetyl-CoA synthetase